MEKYGTSNKDLIDLLQKEARLLEEHLNHLLSEPVKLASDITSVEARLHAVKDKIASIKGH